MAFTGTQLVAGRIPGERIATTIETTDSAAFTAEATVISVTADVVAGRTYRVTFAGGFSSDTSGTRPTVRIREDDTAGNQLYAQNVHIEAASGNPYPAPMEVEFTAGSTASKTCVVTGAIGVDDARLEAAPNHPAYLYVDYIRG